MQQPRQTVRLSGKLNHYSPPSLTPASPLSNSPFKCAVKREVSNASMLFTYGEFITIVKSEMNNDWQPLGQPNYRSDRKRNNHGSERYEQAMVKYEYLKKCFN